MLWKRQQWGQGARGERKDEGRKEERKRKPRF